MSTYIARRLLWMVVMLFAITLLTFVIFHILPAASPAGTEPGLIGYLKQLVLHFNFGYSYHQHVAVRQRILSDLPATISLAAGAVVLSVAIGSVVGARSAIRPRSTPDRLAREGGLVAISTPVLWLSLVAIFLFSTSIGKFPVLPGAGSYVPLTQNPAHWFTSLLMPWLVLAVSFGAFSARVARDNLLASMSDDYVRTARAKGVTERSVVVRHGVRAAVPAVVRGVPLDIGVLVGGLILVESVFHIPGVGRLAFDSIHGHDLPMLQGIVLMGAFLIVIVNVIVDIGYALIDPRVS